MNRIQTWTFIFFLGFMVVLVSANTEPFFKVQSNGLIVTEQGSFASFSEYFNSEYFIKHKKRCLVKQVPMAERIQSDITGSRQDCTLFKTVIKSEYFPAQVLTIPVVFHVIYAANGTGNISNTKIQNQIRVLNQDYAALAGSMGENGYNTKIQFRLESITRTQNDTWFNDQQETTYKGQLAWPQSQYLNIYSNTASGYLGYSYMPQDAAGTVYDGVVILYSAVGGRNNGFDPYDQGRTLVHEIGHYLGLLHTFEGNACENSYESGDLIVDTNSENDEHYKCIQTYSCSTADEIHNYMNYTDDECMYEFTREQANRLVCCLLNYRSGLLLRVYPPANLAIQRLQNDFIFQVEYINRLTWENNPNNTQTISNYRIYRKGKNEADTAYSLLIQVNGAVLSYEDRGKKSTDLYSYRVTAVTESGSESSPETIGN